MRGFVAVFFMPAYFFNADFTFCRMRHHIRRTGLGCGVVWPYICPFHWFSLYMVLIMVPAAFQRALIGSHDWVRWVLRGRELGETFSRRFEDLRKRNAGQFVPIAAWKKSSHTLHSLRRALRCGSAGEPVTMLSKPMLTTSLCKVVEAIKYFEMQETAEELCKTVRDVKDNIIELSLEERQTLGNVCKKYEAAWLPRFTD